MSTNFTGNFGFLLENPDYKAFAKPCMEAERAMGFSYNTVVENSRKALEQVVKWIYVTERFGDITVQRGVPMLGDLLKGPEFVQFMGQDEINKLRKDIVTPGNKSMHRNAQYGKDEALHSLIRLFSFVEGLDRLYNENFVKRSFDANRIPVVMARALQRRKALEAAEQERRRQEEMSQKEMEIAEIRQQLESVRAELVETRKTRPVESTMASFDISEAKTRSIYIDYELRLAGWTLGDDALTEVPVTDMEGHAGQHGFIDYVLNGPDGKPLAVIEAKRASRDVRDGEHQAKLYADCLERKYGYRPFVFLSNGFEIWLADDHFGPLHRVGGFYSPDDLVRRFRQSRDRKDPALVPVNKQIAGRDYQLEAIKAVCDNIDVRHARSLLVMATGTGKTRVSAALVDVLSRAGLVTNVLFLADRIELVRQAKSSFGEYLKNQSLCNLCDDKSGAADSRIVFSTYQTMINAIDALQHPDGSALFGVAHFDLIIIDEAHRSIFNKYGEIFRYFDGLMVGLTATPAKDVDRNTFDFFHVKEGEPTFEYEYAQALAKEYLVPFHSIEGRMKFIDEGITYDELSDEDKQRYEEDFGATPAADDEERERRDLPKHINASELNTFVMNADTVDEVLLDLMENGIRTAGGERLGKTIIFAQTQAHARFIEERFGILYPKESADGWMKVIVHGESYANNAIDEFKTKPLPVIAVSVDMLDTGVDVPEVVNLVFFKKVRSKIKFWQMIGRGTRTCEGLDCTDGLDGEYSGKRRFYIFDYCGNLRFFGQNPEGIPASVPVSLSERIFRQKVHLIESLQSSASTSDDKLMQWRGELVRDVQAQIASIDTNKFIARLHRSAITQFSDEHAFDHLDHEDVRTLDKEIAPLAHYADDDVDALRFDSMMYEFMTLRTDDGKTQMYVDRLTDIASQLNEHMTIPQVREHQRMVKLITGDPAFIGHVDAHGLEDVREELRGLIRFISDSKEEREKAIVFTALQDEVRSRVEGEAFDQLVQPDTLTTYKTNVADYIDKHRDEGAINMIAHNEPVPAPEWSELEDVLMKTIGSQEQYEKAYGDKPVGLTVRRETGMDRAAVRQAFAMFLNANELAEPQREFLDFLLDQIAKNGYIEEEGELYEPPFDRPLTMDRLFSDDQQDAIIDCVMAIKHNAEGPAL